jgi:hypothetical protein
MKSGFTGAMWSLAARGHPQHDASFTTTAKGSYSEGSSIKSAVVYAAGKAGVRRKNGRPVATIPADIPPVQLPPIASPGTMSGQKTSRSEEVLKLPSCTILAQAGPPRRETVHAGPIAIWGFLTLPGIKEIDEFADFLKHLYVM